MVCHPDGLSSRVKRGIRSLPSIKQIASRLVATEGAEILEAAIVLPLVFLFLLGIVEFGRAFNIYAAIQQAAQQGALTAARATCASCASGNTFPTATAVSTAVSKVMLADNLSSSQIHAGSPPNCGPGLPCNACASPPAPPAPTSGPCSSTAGIYVCQNVQLNPSATVPQCGTVVSFQYPFSFDLPFTSLNNQQILLSAQAQSRMEN
jgi:hypothetical protein